MWKHLAEILERSRRAGLFLLFLPLFIGGAILAQVLWDRTPDKRLFVAGASGVCFIAMAPLIKRFCEPKPKLGKQPPLSRDELRVARSKLLARRTGVPPVPSVKRLQSR